MVECYLFLGDPSDTGEESVISGISQRKYSVSTRTSAAPHTANAGGDGLFLLLFSQHELAMGTDYTPLRFLRLYSGILLIKAGKEKPQYFLPY